MRKRGGIDSAESMPPRFFRPVHPAQAQAHRSSAGKHGPNRVWAVGSRVYDGPKSLRDSLAEIRAE